MMRLHSVDRHHRGWVHSAASADAAWSMTNAGQKKSIAKCSYTLCWFPAMPIIVRMANDANDNGKMKVYRGVGRYRPPAGIDVEIVHQCGVEVRAPLTVKSKLMIVSITSEILVVWCFLLRKNDLTQVIYATGDILVGSKIEWLMFPTIMGQQTRFIEFQFSGRVVSGQKSVVKLDTVILKTLLLVISYKIWNVLCEDTMLHSSAHFKSYCKALSAISTSIAASVIDQLATVVEVVL